MQNPKITCCSWLSDLSGLLWAFFKGSPSLPFFYSSAPSILTVFIFWLTPSPAPQPLCLKILSNYDLVRSWEREGKYVGSSHHFNKNSIKKKLLIFLAINILWEREPKSVLLDFFFLLIHVSGIHRHVWAPSISGCALVYFAVLYIEYSSTVSLFQAQDAQKQA